MDDIVWALARRAFDESFRIGEPKRFMYALMDLYTQHGLVVMGHEEALCLLYDVTKHLEDELHQMENSPKH